MTELPHGFQNENERFSFLERVSHYQDGLLSPLDATALMDEINADPVRREEFIQWQIRSAEIYDAHHQQTLLQRSSEPLNAELPPGNRAAHGRRPETWWQRACLGAGTALAMLVIVLVARQRFSVPPVATLSVPTERETDSAANSPATRKVVLAEEVRAVFVGSASPQVGSLLEPLQNYFLTVGLIKLIFPNGAVAIIEAPAMFQVRDELCLALEIGACSVHAPKGAEGFRVVTPVTDVVDRGTRFSVKVADSSETEIHVVEGIADLYPNVPTDSTRESPAQRREQEIAPIRLQDHQAMRIGAFLNDAYESTPFNPKAYRRELPDRIVRYEATRLDGLVDELQSVTVQRGGELRTYSIEALIPIQVTWFHGEADAERSGHLSGGPVRPLHPQEWMEDRKLHTGFMNIGGQAQPLDHDPVMTVNGAESAAGTPGLGVRFHSPVVNSPGPDVVLFDVQHFLQTLEGDPFHVSPIHFRPGLKSWTVRRFDLTINSPESLIVPPFWRHKYSQPIRSMAELGTAESQSNLRSMPIPVQAIAAGIDLSDLGFAAGEEVRELFFQHALEEGQPAGQTGIPSRIDPVFIAGLPE